MYVALERRKHTYLADHQWLQGPCDGDTKTLRDCLNDLGLQVPRQLQLADEVTKQDSAWYAGSVSLESRALHRLVKISDLQGELEQWLNRLESGTDGPLFWSSLAPPDGRIFPDDSECRPKHSSARHRVVFPCGPIAGLLVQFWCLRLELLLTSMTLLKVVSRRCGVGCSGVPDECDRTRKAWSQQ
jgi:hypothetical protein